MQATGAKPLNTYWVIPGRLLAGEYPGHPEEDRARIKLADFLDAGVTGFLDLTERGESGLEPYQLILSDLARERGIDCAYLRMPIPDVSVPREPSHMHAILDRISAWMDDDRTVYVHCWGGVGRTGTVVGCALVEQGRTGDEALDHIRTLWKQMSDDKRRRHPESPETRQQEQYIRDWRNHARLV